MAGNAKLMKREQIPFDQPEDLGTIVHISIDRAYAGYIVISDEVKEDLCRGYSLMKELGIKKTVMLTGDSKTVGEDVGRKLGLDQVHAESLPQHKVEEIEKLDQQKTAKEKIILLEMGLTIHQY